MSSVRPRIPFTVARIKAANRFPLRNSTLPSVTQTNQTYHSLPFAFLISPLERVVRSDGTRILVSEKLGTKAEMKLIKVTWTSKLILLSAIWALWSFFYR